MGRMFSVGFTDITLNSATDLFELTVAANRPIKIWHWNVSQRSDLSDANEEVLLLTLKKNVTAGSGGSSVTPVAADISIAAVTTVNRTVTTAGSGGAAYASPRGWNIRVPEDHWFTPETAPRIDAGEDPVVLSLSAPADHILVSGTLIFEEA